MMKRNSINSFSDMPSGPVTRAQAAASRANVAFLSSVTSNPRLPDKKQTQQRPKRAACDENCNVANAGGLQGKRRAVLKDISNFCCENKSRRCIPSVKLQSRVPQQIKRGSIKVKGISSSKISKLAPDASVGNSLVYSILKDSSAHAQQITHGPSKVHEVSNSKHPKLVPDTSVGDSSAYGILKDESFTGLDHVDIDTDHTNPQMCCAYASEIYTNLRSAELIRRPSSNFMETLQQDITYSMRGILIDWLVEVADEYGLVPDTLYLTIYIIDRFLSQNYIERQGLQLLGITCMLIASKYEEICAPRVEEFCNITDNTYTKAEVLKMEIEVLNYLRFQLSVPTTKTFLRRFLHAAQASSKDILIEQLTEAPSLVLGYLANYLAELTLVEYSFIKFVPSVIAASAIFLARWTLDQSNHPWNQTLEHYTSYKAVDLKIPVLALQELQANSKNCPLNAIREKYKQRKFESVATLASPELQQSLFC